MMRTFIKRPVSALAQQRRTIAAETTLFAGAVAHGVQLLYPASYAPATIAYSPVGTAGLALLSYNVNVVSLKHLWYTLEFVAKDYVQDVVLQVWMRYMILISLLLGVEQLFVES